MSIYVLVYIVEEDEMMSLNKWILEYLSYFVFYYLYNCLGILVLFKKGIF